jgi:hypothetical protein
MAVNDAATATAIANERYFTGLTERHVPHIGAPPVALPRAGMVGENPPHHARRDREEMGAVLPARRLIDESKVGFVNQGGGLQRVGAFPRHVTTGHPVELVVDERHEGSSAA